MSFNVRIYGYKGMRQVPNLSAQQFTGDTVYAMDEPYEWVQKISVNGDVMTPGFVTVNPDKSSVIRVEVPPGAAVRYEVNPTGRNVAAGDNSPRLSGVDVFPWGQGWSFSMVDGAGHP